MMQTKVKKVRLFINIWILHIFIYYFSYGNIDNYLKNHFMEWSYFEKESLQISILSPILGFAGWYDNFPFFVLIPITFMLVLIKFIKVNWFRLYIATCCTCYGLMYILNAFHDAENRLYMSRIFEEKDYELNIIFLIIPSLLLAIICNYFVFRNSYRKLKDYKNN